MLRAKLNVNLSCETNIRKRNETRISLNKAKQFACNELSWANTLILANVHNIKTEDYKFCGDTKQHSI